MAPPGRRTRGAKREIQEQSDTPEAINTPTRKRRKVNAAAPAPPPDSRVPTRPPSAQSDRTVGSDDEREYGGKMTTEELLTTVVPHLRIASYVTNAQIELSNDLQKRDPIIAQRGSTEAYAKIEGHAWVYFAKSTQIIIGRGEHGYSASASNGNNASSQQNGLGIVFGANQPTSSTQVNIDLGPDKQVSRIHAWIEYESDQGHWFIIVNGRNGLKLDDRTLTRGEKNKLHSGSVINVCGTDMIFVCPGEELYIHPSIMARAKNSDEEGQEEDSYHGMNNGYGKSADSRGQPPTGNQNQSNSRQTGHAPGQTQLAPTSTPAGPILPNTPMPSRTKAQQSSPKVKTSPATVSGAYSRGVMLESTEQIDYSADSAKDLKPPHSYAQLIGQAIMASPEEQLTLANIYEYIKTHYAFYRFNGGGWQNSIRHNLSLSKHFEKVARRTDEPGKGMKWRLVPDERDAFLKKGIHTRKTRMASSGPNSPAINQNSPAIAQAAERLQGAVTNELTTPQPNKFRVKESPRSVTPPLTSYPTANESYTPDRGPQPPRNKPQLSNQIFTPVNDRKHDASQFANVREATFGRPIENSTLASNIAAAESKDHETAPTPAPPRSSVDIEYSPPTTNGYKSTALNDMPEPTALGLVTPLIAKNRPHLAPPSTAKMPSQFCYLSSPAPFWKYADLGSTPARGYNDFSPIKEPKPLHLLPVDDDDDEDEDEEKEDHEEEDNGAEAVQPSSPPVVLGDTASRSREGSNSGEGSQEPTTPTRPSSRRFNTAEEEAVKKQLPTQLDAGIEDKEDDEGIDLMKGFQNIGSFHRGLNQSFIRRA
ncbi:uncharacterized protein K452DRAFT_327981 [Aplosporella prunicola CBS 121167]|uniref:Fork-head domain-containing protein n=1 Tax=Aplosporella prunicola CBS 121167 TaxID=1176127 RepID=A0A6A6B5W7_9PEZI|nr:uncharacterized protein K452DRAFT_327981 [Aplosporella prunicola CBS 121167]KAF2139509.1 hypothetical protein K452DRAFT_327981 [Aplosporella prunicola CBS 121167]